MKKNIGDLVVHLRKNNQGRPPKAETTTYDYKELKT